MLDELQDYFGCQITYEVLQKKMKVPLFMSTREMYCIKMMGISFVLVNIANNDSFGISALKKQYAQYTAESEMNVAFHFQAITQSQRNILVKNMIPFISLPGNVFLPFLGIILNDKFKNNNIKNDKMMPATQALFLYLFYTDKEEKKLKSQVAVALNLTRTSITRASKQLQKMGLIEQNKTGKEIHMSCKWEGKEFYEKAKPFLTNPIQKVIYIIDENISDKLVKAGETALGEQTMLNPPATAEYAIYKDDKLVNQFQIVDKKWTYEAEPIKVELWKYDPKLFSKKGIVDTISLVTSLGDSKDERIEMAVDELLGEAKWL